MADISDVLDIVRSREIDRASVDQTKLDVIARARTSALSWRGQFTPGLPELLIEKFRGAGTVLDPFVGSGTTLGECVRLGISSVGAEINPAAFSLANIYKAAAVPVEERMLARKLANHAVQEILTRSLAGLPVDGYVQDKLAAAVRAISNETAHDLLVAILLISMGNAKTTNARKLKKAWFQVVSLLNSLPAEPVATSILTADARALPIEDNTVGMVLTSPPYINVFNYHQNYRPAVELLGWDVLPAARSEIGSNRKYRANRFLTVIQYCIDIAQCLDELVRVCRDRAPVVFVVGRESRVRGLSFPNGDIVSALAEISPSIDFENWQERSFTSRFGERVYEEILTLRVDKAESSRGIEPSAAMDLARALLLEHIDGTTELSSDVMRDLRAALAQSSGIPPSPALTLQRAAA